MRSQIEPAFARLHKNCEIRLLRLLSAASVPPTLVLSSLRFSRFRLSFILFSLPSLISRTPSRSFAFFLIFSALYSLYISEFPSSSVCISSSLQASALSLILLRDARYRANRSSPFHSWTPDGWGSEKIQSRTRSWTQETERNRALRAISSIG